MTQFDWLISSFPETVFTVFDTETTGLDPKLCKVVEVGGIRFDSRGIKSRFNVLINPKSPMPAEVTKINGITDAMLAGQPETANVMPDFLRFIGDSVLIAHNAPFDISFINEELARLGKPALKNKVIDTRIFAKEMFPGLPKYALQDLATRFGIKALDAHRAEDDARVCLELFMICFDALKAKNPASAPALQSAEPQKTSPSNTPSTVSIRLESEQEDLFTDEPDDEDFFDETQI